MDLIRSSRDEIACQEEGRSGEDFESVEANDWCHLGKSAPAWYLTVHARLMLPTGPRHESFIFSYRGPASTELILVPRQSRIVHQRRNAGPEIAFTGVDHASVDVCC
jgi:hypothetical protein